MGASDDEERDGRDLRSSREIQAATARKWLRELVLEDGTDGGDGGRFVRALGEMRRARRELESLAWKRYKETHSDLRTLSVVLFVWFLAGYTMALAGVVAAMRAPKGNGAPGFSTAELILPDLGFEAMQRVWLPEFSNDPTSPGGMYNVVMTLVVAMTTLRVIAHPERVLIWRRLLIVHSVICFVRSFFIVMTSLPDPYHACHDFVVTRNPLIEAAGRAASFGFTACGDVFFSGHMATCVLCANVWRTYTRQTWLTVFVGVLVALEAAYMLKLQFHYSIDIAIGSYISHRVYESFHSNLSPLFGWLEASPVVLDSSDEDIGEC
jgi:PAP2 superfamily C-terminal